MNTSAPSETSEKTSVSVRSTLTVVLAILMIFWFPLLLLFNPLYNYQMTGSISLDAIFSWENVREALIFIFLLGILVIPIVCMGARQCGRSSSFDE